MIKLQSIILLFSSAVLFAQSPYTNVLISSQGGPEEVSIIINPKNTNQVTAGANITNYYWSTDGGTSWSSGTIVSSSWGVWGDPICSVDTTGVFFYYHLAQNPSLPFPNWIDRIVSQKSTNGGATYIDPGTYMGLNPGKLQDKEGVGVDWTHGPRGNWIYVTWTQFDDYGQNLPNDSSRILFSRSSDAGNTWSSAIRINHQSGRCLDDDFTMEGAVPSVGPNGEVYVAWAGPSSFTGPDNFKIFFDKSTDGGNTWLPDNIIAGNQRGGWDYVVPGVYRNNGLPSTLCDVSNGPFRGNIYINYTDSAGADDHDVMVLRSTNGGANWSAPIRVNDDPPGKEQFFSWMAIDQVTGYIYIVFYDRRNYADAFTDVYMAHSTDGGSTWINERISSSPFQPTNSVFFGDYNGISAYNGHIRPMWTRLSGNQLSVWTALINFPIGIEPVSNEIPKQFSLYQNYPNPFNPSTKIKFDLPEQNSGMTTLKVYDALGKLVSTLVSGELNAGRYEINWDASGLSGGVYFYTLRSGSLMQTRKLVVAK